jgi:mono/diheme cytochrome c family protein
MNDGYKLNWTRLVLAALVATTIGCVQANPREPAEPIGTFPVWGQNFQEDTQPSNDSMLLGDTKTPEGPAPKVADDSTEAKGGSAVPAANPMANEDWSGGSAEAGKIVFINQCALCHGPNGKGGEKPGIGTVPTLRDPEWQDRMTDGRIAKTITHGRGAMPSFMGKLSKDDLTNVVAFVRTLKRSATKPAQPQAGQKQTPATGASGAAPAPKADIKPKSTTY